MERFGVKMGALQVVGAGGGGHTLSVCVQCGAPTTFFEEYHNLDNPGEGRIKEFFCEKHRPGQPRQRKYLPTLSDLVDRLTIVQLKAVFIPEHKEEYVKERALIENDIDLILEELASREKRIGASEIHAIIVIMLSNRFIWENESKAREGGSEQDHLLKLTHSINGVRNTAKNQLAKIDGGRHDYKTDCFASELVASFGNWNIFS